MLSALIAWLDVIWVLGGTREKVRVRGKGRGSGEKKKCRLPISLGFMHFACWEELEKKSGAGAQAGAVEMLSAHIAWLDTLNLLGKK